MGAKNFACIISLNPWKNSLNGSHLMDEEIEAQSWTDKFVHKAITWVIFTKMEVNLSWI